MTTTEKINEALQILRGHDWFWYMVERNYKSYEESARANMKAFVKVAHEIGGTIEQTLRSLWMLDRELNAYMPTISRSEYEAKKAELMAIIPTENSTHLQTKKNLFEHPNKIRNLR